MQHYLVLIRGDKLLLSNDNRLIKSNLTKNLLKKKYRIKGMQIVKKKGDAIISGYSKAAGNWKNFEDAKYNHRIIMEGLSSLFLWNGNYIYYGGTFNPWHKGHMACVTSCYKAFKKNIVILPDHSPWKNRLKDSWKRYLSIRKELKGTSFIVYPGLLLKKTFTPTYKWITNIKGTRALLMGDDSFLNILKWNRSDILLKELDQVVVALRDYSKQEVKKMINILKKYHLKITILPRNAYYYMNSTAIRNETR